MNCYLIAISVLFTIMALAFLAASHFRLEREVKALKAPKIPVVRYTDGG